MDMLRYSLNQDELVSPAEKRIKEAFFHKTNVDTVTRDVHSKIDARISRGCVVDSMHCVFVNMLGHNELISIDQLNSNTVQEVFRKKTNSDKASQISRRVGFERSKIPTTILPRPSFSVETDDENVHGDTGYTLFR